MALPTVSHERPVALVTGTTSGIGLALATGLAGRGFHVVMHARDERSGVTARDAVRARSRNGQVDLLHGDLAVQAEVRGLAERFLARYERLDVLLHNAGVYHPQMLKTPDGIEETFAVNHLAPFLLTRHLVHRLEETAKAHGPTRIVTVASQAHHAASFDADDPEMTRGYRGWQQYGNTKLMNILWTRALARRMDHRVITANAYHPGIVRTRLAREAQAIDPLFQLFGRSVDKGADTGLWLATEQTMQGMSGGYYGRRKPAATSKTAQDDAVGERLWARSEDYVAGLQKPP